MVAPSSDLLKRPDGGTASSRKSLKRFLSYVRPYRGVLAAAVAFGIVRYLVPLALPWTLKVLVDDFLQAHSARPHVHLHLLMAGLCALYVLYALASYWRSYLAGLAGHRLIFDLRQALYLHVQRMSLSFFDRQRIGAVVSRMTTDIASAQNFVGAAFVNTVMDLSCVAVIILLLFLAHPKLALVSLAVLPCYGLVSYSLQKRIREKSRLIHHQLQEMSGSLHEQFAGISTIQAFTQEEAEAQEFREQSEAYFSTVMGNVKLQSIALGATGFLTALGPILVLWFGVMEVWAGALTVGTLMAFYGYLGMLYQPIQRLTELNLILANSIAAMDRIFEVFDMFPEVRECSGARSLGRLLGEVAFEDVGFHYEGRGPVLKRLSLRIPAGTTLALVGPSGAGKSTFVKLLPRFYDVTSGRITIDKIDIRDVTLKSLRAIDIRDVTLKSLRAQIAIVSQEPILFSGTIADNLRYGKPTATDAQLRAAARAAFADTFIEEMPDGYETQIGERGVRLSGGEKQRLAIARAFLKDAPILILDEPTSALDAESEELVKRALQRLLEGRTALIIAHRLSTIEHVDVVVVLDEGRVIEQGRHEELLKLHGGLYRRYAERQLAPANLVS
ncbi:MAG: ABC transporter ATP-binding protein [Candidatus Omnitrophica bacterium]|nr:ABC transporter ATP-binding protein [Candidatus Omnitrophota bacterium]